MRACSECGSVKIRTMTEKGRKGPGRTQYDHECLSCGHTGLFKHLYAESKGYTHRERDE